MEICLVPQSTDHTSNPYAYLAYISFITIASATFQPPITLCNVSAAHTKMPRSKKTRKKPSKTEEEKSPQELVLTPTSSYGKLCFFFF